MQVKGSKIHVETQMYGRKRTYVYNECTKVCGDDHRIKWPLRDTEELKGHNFFLCEQFCIKRFKKVLKMIEKVSTIAAKSTE